MEEERMTASNLQSRADNLKILMEKAASDSEFATSKRGVDLERRLKAGEFKDELSVIKSGSTRQVLGAQPVDIFGEGVATEDRRLREEAEAEIPEFKQAIKDMPRGAGRQERFQARKELAGARRRAGKGLVGGVLEGAKKLVSGLGIGSKERAEIAVEAGERASDQALRATKILREAQATGDKEAEQRALDILTITGTQLSGLTGDELVEEFVTGGATEREALEGLATLASTVLGAGTISAAPGALASTQTAVQTGAQLAKEGAIIGGVTGIPRGIANAFGKEEPEDVTAGDILKGAAQGAVTDAAIGGAVGFVSGFLANKFTGAIRKYATASGQAQKKIDDAIEITAPKLNKKDRVAAIQSGRLNHGGFFREDAIDPSAYDIQVADAASDVISKRNKPAKNIQLLVEKTDDLATNLKKSLEATDTPLDVSELDEFMQPIIQDKKDFIFAGDNVSQAAYESVYNRYKQIYTNLKSQFPGQSDLSLALEARKQLDNQMHTSFNLFSKEAGDNARRNGMLDIRQMINRFINDKSGLGDTFKDSLLQQHLLLTARDNIAENSVNLVGKTGLKRFLSTPAGRITKTLVGGSAAGVVGSSLLGD